MIILVALISILSPESRDSLLADTPGNEAFWSEALLSSRGEMLECVEHIFVSAPRLDRLEMTSEALMDHVIGALDSRDAWLAGMPDSIFLDCLLQYRLDEEPVTPYRTPLMTRWTARLGEGDTTLTAVAERLAWSIGALRVRGQDIMGGIAGPRDVLASGGGTPVELRVLLGSSLRSMGIPVRPVLGWFQGEDGREAGWLEYWDGSTWTPLPLPSDSIPDGFAGLSLAVAGEEYITKDRTRTGTVAFTPLPDSVPDLLVTLSIPCRGRLIPLDWIEIDPFTPCTLEVGEGSYYLHLSERQAFGGVLFATEEIEVVADGVMSINLTDLTGVF